MPNKKVEARAFLAHDRAVTVMRMYFRMVMINFFVTAFFYLIGAYAYFAVFLSRPVPEIREDRLAYTAKSKKLPVRSIIKYYISANPRNYLKLNFGRLKNREFRLATEKVEPELRLLLDFEEVPRETYKLAVAMVVGQDRLDLTVRILPFSFLLFPVSCFGYIAYFAYKSRKQEADRHIRGAQLLPFEEMKAALDAAVRKENTKKPLVLGEVELANSVSRLHMLILGTSGTGKSVALNRFITSLMGNGRAVIYDVKGEFAGKHYDEKKDIIFYPFDERSVSWNFFNEVESYPDFDVLATSLYQPPKPGSENEYWYNSARDVFRTALIYLYQQEKHEKLEEKRRKKAFFQNMDETQDKKETEYNNWKSNEGIWKKEYAQWKSDIRQWRMDIKEWRIDIENWEKAGKKDKKPQKPVEPEKPERPDNPINMRYINSEPRTNNAVWEFFSLSTKELKEKLNYVDDRDRSGLKHIENTESNAASSIVSIVQERLTFFRYLCEEEGEAPGKFSFRKFIRGEEKAERIFLMNIQQFESIFRPLMTFVVDIMTREVLSLTDDKNRRVTFVIDEFGSLAKLSSIFGFLTMARSKGGFLVLVNQDLGSIAEIYGKEKKETFFNNFNIHLTFRLNDPETSEFLTRAFGEQEVTKKNRSSSFGPTDSGDRFTLNEQDKLEKIVLSTEFQTLPNFHTFLKIANFGATKMITEPKFTAKKDSTPEFLPKSFTLDDIEAISEEQIEKQIAEITKRINQRFA